MLTLRPAYGAAVTLEYHDVAAGADGSLPAGGTVTRGHLARIAAAYDPTRHLLTFDDGYTGVYTHALPVLRAARVPAVASIVVR